MKEKIYDLLESNKIRWAIDTEGECTVCGWDKSKGNVHVCNAINELLNSLDEQISKL